MYNLVLIFKILFDGITHPECKYLSRASMCWHPWDFYKFQIECSGWLHLRPNYLKLWKERFKNPFFKIWTYIMLLTKSKSNSFQKRTVAFWNINAFPFSQLFSCNYLSICTTEGIRMNGSHWFQWIKLWSQEHILQNCSWK